MSAVKCNEAGLKQLSELKEGWNSYGAKPIDPRCLRAVRLFSIVFFNPDYLPWAIPTVDGGIQLEWWGGDISIQFGPDGKQVID